MAEQRYRFGGPIPESVQRLKRRREWRSSRLYATVKRGRARGAASSVSVSAAPASCPSVESDAVGTRELNPIWRPVSGAPFPEEGCEAILPISRDRGGFWQLLAARIFRGGR